MATLSSIKNELNVKTLEFFKVKDQEGYPGAWNRATTLDGDFIIIHDETLERVKTNPDLTTLFLKKKPDVIFHDKETGEIAEVHRSFILCIGSEDNTPVTSL